MTYVYTKASYRDYWHGRVFEVRDINQKIWGFVCAAALIEIGAKLSNSGVSSGDKYKEFVLTLGPKYSDFTFSCGKKDLNDQMWHVLRCGMLHSFTLLGDDKGKPKARDNTFQVSSLNDGQTAADNVTNYTGYGRDACLLVLEPFVEDIWNAFERVFDDPGMEDSIKKCAEIVPPFNVYA